MSKLEFHPEQAIGEGLLRMDKQELLQFVSRLCLHLKAEIGSRAYHGGLFPENICTDGEGHFAVGPAKMEKWSGQELEFVAPELYWHGVSSPASDVYSLALLVYYGLNEGKLPFETATASGQLARMSGKTLPAPKNAGKRLAEVLEKATAFQAADRYQSPEELQIMLESCMDNKYLGGASGAEAVFRKEDDQLSEIERMMVDIIEREQEPEGREESPALPEGLSPEEMAGLERPHTEPQEKEDISAAVEEFFGSLSGLGEDMPPVDDTEEEEIRVYEPSKEKKDRPPIPILTEEKHPELAPVVLQKQAPRPRREEKPEEPPAVDEQEVSERRNLRPLALVLIVCLSLIAGALALNLYWNRDPRPAQSNPAPDPTRSAGGVTMQPSVQPLAQDTPEPTLVSIPTLAPQQEKYEVIPSDMSWTEAQAACYQRGGHLAVISSQEELYEIAALAEAQGLTRIWVGCHRVNGNLLWETEELIGYYNWGKDEPSFYYNNMAEDFIMIYRQGDQWLYNDSVEDPAGLFPDFYSGILGYACELDRGAAG